MKELTDRARKNLESGATSGPGTYVCGNCTGPKEATRLNSHTCRACQPSRVTVTHRLVVGVSPEALAELTAQAAAAGATLTDYVEGVLNGLAAAVSPPDVTPEQWAHFREWVKAHPGTLLTYVGSRHWSRPEDRAAVYRWAQAEQGYTPDQTV